MRPTEATRIEVAATWEGWSVHDAINVAPAGGGIRIVEARAVGTYDVGNVSIARSFQDVWSVRLGAEHRFDLGSYGLTARAGFSYDTAATPPQYTSVLTFDADKATVSLGASLSRGRLRLDAVYAHTFWGPVEVTPCAYDPRAPSNCQGLYPTAPFRTGANAPRYTVNGGTYEPSLNVFGLGMRYAF